MRGPFGYLLALVTAGSMLFLACHPLVFWNVPRLPAFGAVFMFSNTYYFLVIFSRFPPRLLMFGHFLRSLRFWCFRTLATLWTSSRAFCCLNVFHRLLRFGRFPRSLLFYVFALVLHSGRLLPFSVVWSVWTFSTLTTFVCFRTRASFWTSPRAFCCLNASALASVWTFSTLTTFLLFRTRASFWTSPATFCRLNVFRVC